MFRKLSLQEMYQDGEQVPLKDLVRAAIIRNVYPAIAFMASSWVFKTFVFNDSMTVVWK